jgi:hypothetical protein
MASKFALDRYHHLDSATHAKEWLIMRDLDSSLLMRIRFHSRKNSGSARDQEL